MCAWKRGTQNNQPGAIRKGHIKEFLRLQEGKEFSISANLKILEAENPALALSDHYLTSAFALVCSKDNGLPDKFFPFISYEAHLKGVLYLHAHEFPQSVISAIISESVPHGCIILNQVHRVNSKVCTGEIQLFSVFQGDVMMYDCREGAMGDNTKRVSNKFPSSLQGLVLEVKPLYENSKYENNTEIVINSLKLAESFSRNLLNCVVTTEEIYLTDIVDENGLSIRVVGRIKEIFIDDGSDDDDCLNTEDLTLEDSYRGLVDPETQVFLIPDFIPDEIIKTRFIGLKPAPAKKIPKDIVNIKTNDDEIFPVKRNLLRPCISLTSVTQAGKGIYKTNNPAPDETKTHENIEVFIDIDACTFDRVLLYLEHEARNEVFLFDPLLAPVLRTAALTLGVRGLEDICDRVLGSFEERVRKTPIRLEEVYGRNQRGGEVGSGSKRGETLLLLDGMVLDITRWLPEHPGGSLIIPEQGLNVDCTVFFEIYHVSRQSFLYLKEFYIGELALEDRVKVRLPSGDSCESGKASDAFLEQLRRVTPWRLDVNNMNLYENYKSF